MVDCGVTYFGVRRLQHAKRDLDNIAEHGATFVVHTLSENDWSLYYDTMGKIVQATRNNGMKAWLEPWSLGYVFGADDDSLFGPANPEICQVDQFGRITPCACLNQPKFRDFVKHWIDAAVDLGADVLFWDEPHLYWWEWFYHNEFYKPPQGRWGCRCSLCKSIYEERYGEQMPTDSEDQGVVAFKAFTLKSFLDEILSYAKTKNVKNALCLLPYEFESERLMFADEIASLIPLDNLGTDPYPFPFFDQPPLYVDKWREYISGYLTKLLELCGKHNKENHFWVQGFSLPVNDRGYLDNVMDILVDHGIKSIPVWGFDGHRDMSAFACEDPDKAWTQIGKAFKRVRGIE